MLISEPKSGRDNNNKRLFYKTIIIGGEHETSHSKFKSSKEFTNKNSI